MQLKFKLEGRLHEELSRFCDVFNQTKAGATREALRLYLKDFKEK